MFDRFILWMNDVSRNRSARDWFANGSAANGILERLSPPPSLPRFASSLLEVGTSVVFFVGATIDGRDSSACRWLRIGGCLINGISASSSRSESRESTEGIRLRLWSSKEPHHVDFNNTRHPARPDDLVAWRSAQIRSVSQNPLLFLFFQTDLQPHRIASSFQTDHLFLPFHSFIKIS